MIVNIPLLGPQNKGYSLPVDNQSTINFFYEVNGDRVALHGTPSLLEFADTGGGANRGALEFDGDLYAVNGNTLYRIDSAANVTNIGLITGSNQCGMTDAGTHLVITTGGTGYVYDGTLAAITDTDYQSANTSAYLNSRTYYDGDDGQFQAAAINDPTTISGLDVATAESAPDDTLAVEVHKQNLLLFGAKTVEPWYNSGVGNPPVDRITGGIQPYGLAAVHAVGQNADYVYFLSHERLPVRLNGLTAQDVSTPALANEWRLFSTVEDAKVFCVTWNSERFAVFTFPAANRTYAYQESVNMWFRLQSGTGRHKANDCVYIWNKNIVPDHTNGKIYEWALGTYTDDGAEIIRERSTVHLHAGLISQNLHGREVTCNWLELTLETGVGLVTGQGETPYVMMTYSDDGGRTWSPELWRSAGVLGAYATRIIWEDLGAFVNRQFRFRMSDPVKWSLIRLAADIEVGI